MPRKAQQSLDWNFNVQTQRLFLADGTPTEVFGNVRTDTKQVVGTCSESGYGLLQNWDFVLTVRTALEGLGLTDYKENILTANDGKRLYVTYNFDNRIRHLHKVGDQVGLVLRFANSFDGSVAAMGEVMARILRCLNGMVLEKGKFRLAKRHNAKINLGFIKDVIAKSVNEFDSALAVFDALAAVSVSDAEGINILKHIAISKAIRERIEAIWITPSFAVSRARNLYTLYDACTEHFRDLEASRFEQAAKLNRVALKKIVSALDPDTFRELIKSPIVTDIQVTTEVIG